VIASPGMRTTEPNQAPFSARRRTLGGNKLHVQRTVSGWRADRLAQQNDTYVQKQPE
jgi:hypothetical protein